MGAIEPASRPARRPRPIHRIGAIAGLLALFNLFARTPRAFPAVVGPSAVNGSSIDDALRARGLLPPDPPSNVQPRPGTEVDEYVQKAGDSGKELVHYQQWQENLDGRTLLIQALEYPANQRTIAWWLMQPTGPGCDAFGSRTYNGKGDEIGSSTWRNDPGQRLSEGPDFPPDLLPGWVPPLAFIRAFDGGKTEGTLHVQANSSGVLDLDVWTDGEVDLVVAGKTLRATRIEMRPNVGGFLSSLPGFIRKIAQSLVRVSTFYFEAKPPYRLLKIDAANVGASDTKTELVRFHTAEAK